MKIVHNGGWTDRHSWSKSRQLVSTICACTPTVLAILDMCQWTTVPVSRNIMFCDNAMSPRMKEASLWLRMTVSFLFPLIALLYCNGMIAYTLKKYTKNATFGEHVTNTLRRATMLPVVTVAAFLCCWTPWIISLMYYRWHRDCNKAIVLNICTGIGHVYCVANPTLYIIMGNNAKCAGAPQQQQQQQQRLECIEFV